MERGKVLTSEAMVDHAQQRVRQLTSSSSQWIKRTTTDKVWLCESVGKLKGVGKLAISKINELRIHTIADQQLHVSHHGKLHI